MEPKATIEQAKDTTLNDYQQMAMLTAEYGDGIDYLTRDVEDKDIARLLKLFYVTAGICGEAGELSNKIKKILRDRGGYIGGGTRHMLMLELGDILWYVAATASELGFALSDVAMINITRLKARQKEDKIKGEGDER